MARKMKDSGIEWIGEIPEEWKMRKIKYILQERNEKNNPIKSTEILSLTANQGVIPYSEKEGGGNKPKKDLTAYIFRSAMTCINTGFPFLNRDRFVFIHHTP